MRGYREMFVRAGYIDQETVPSHARVFVRLAPPDIPAAVMSWASNDGSGDIIFTPQEVTSLRVEVDDRSFIGFGLAGMISAGIAGALDHQLAPWALYVEGPSLSLVMYAEHGPPPSNDEWARIQVRLDSYVQPALDAYGSYQDDEVGEGSLPPLEVALMRARLKASNELCGIPVDKRMAKLLRECLKFTDKYGDGDNNPIAATQLILKCSNKLDLLPEAAEIVEEARCERTSWDNTCEILSAMGGTLLTAQETVLEALDSFEG